MYLVLRKIGQRLISVLNGLPSKYDVVCTRIHQTLHTMVLACWEQANHVSVHMSFFLYLLALHKPQEGVKQVRMPVPISASWQ